MMDDAWVNSPERDRCAQIVAEGIKYPATSEGNPVATAREYGIADRVVAHAHSALLTKLSLATEACPDPVDPSADPMDTLLNIGAAHCHACAPCDYDGIRRVADWAYREIMRARTEVRP